MSYVVDDNGNRAHIMLSGEGSSNRKGIKASNLGKLSIVTFSEWKNVHVVEDKESQDSK